MGKRNFIQGLSQFISFRWDLIYRRYRKQFYLDIIHLNYSRLKIVGYFAIVFSIAQLLSDIFLRESWNTRQVSNFIKLDIALFMISSSVVAITHLFPVSDFSSVKTGHKLFTYSIIVIMLFWSGLVSLVEFQSSGNTNTYLITVFMIVTIFILRDFAIAIFLVSSLVMLYTGLYISGESEGKLFTIHASMLALILIAWIVSRVLFQTRLKSFLATKEIEKAKNDLDVLVKARTVELSDTNDKLIEEIKERKRYEKSLVEERKKAQAADHLKTIFLANMSHEIRTPLNGILGFGDLLRNPELSLEKKERYLEIIGNNSQQLLKIIDDILDISMIETNQVKVNLSRFRLRVILAEIIEFYKNVKRNINKDHIELIYEGYPDTNDDFVYSDPLRLQQIIYNLINNALKFTQNGHIKLGCKIENGYALIYVEDTGIGIIPEKCDTIFQPFRQGEETITRSYGGAGLGLSISKGLVELLGGIIWVDLSYKNGSRFCFSLPTEKAVQDFSCHSIKEFTGEICEKCVIIANSINPYQGFMTYLVHYTKAGIPVYNFSDFRPEIVSSSPKILIFDTLSDEEALSELLPTILESFKNSEIIVVTNNNNPDASIKLQKSGCSLVINAPANLHLMLIYMLKTLTKGSLG